MLSIAQKKALGSPKALAEWTACPVVTGGLEHATFPMNRDRHSNHLNFPQSSEEEIHGFFVILGTVPFLVHSAYPQIFLYKRFSKAVS